MVRPKSKKSVSRRSSILKAPVVQQTLQHVKDNLSLYQETSITIKQKRRVSFADKKHIKEFCDSVEQGTVWDITYEESSHENSEQVNSNNKHYEIINKDYEDISDDRVTCENLNVVNNSLDLTEAINTMGSFKPMCVEENSIKKSTPILCQNTHYDFCADKSTVFNNDKLSVNDTENAPLNKTCTQDVSMEITEIPCIIKSRNILPITDKLFEDKENIPMLIESDGIPILQNNMNKESNQTRYSCTDQLEFTECLQSVIKPTELQAKLSKATFVSNNKDLTNQKTKIFQDVPMKITDVIPVIDSKKFVEQTSIFHNTPMDNTMIVTSARNENEIVPSISISETESDRTKLLDESMEMTTKICSLSVPKTIDAATDAANILNYEHSSIYHNKNTQSNDDTMEFTVAITNLPPITESNKCIILSQTRLSPESTKIFQNESMEITEALHVPKNLHSDDIKNSHNVPTNSLTNKEGLSSSRTQIFQDESMAITVPLHTSKILHTDDIQQVNETSINSVMNNENVILSKTQIFQDESMAITVPIHTSNASHSNNIQKSSDIPINPVTNKEDLSSRTQIFQDESMAITVPLHTSKILHNDDIQQVNETSTNSVMNNEDVILSKTQIFQDESMAITVPIHTSNASHSSNVQKSRDVPINPVTNNEDLSSSRTQIFQDESMAITVPINTSNASQSNDVPKSRDIPINPVTNNEDITLLNPRTFQNMSMDITSAVTNLPMLYNSSKLYETMEKDYVKSNINEKKDNTITNNKATSGFLNDTTDSCAANCIEDVKNSSTEQRPVNALTSLISSFVYADMIEDDLLFKAINESELQSIKNSSEEETKCQKNNIETSTIDTVEIEMENIQFSEKCTTRNKEILREHESYIEYHQKDNIQKENMMIVTEENNQPNLKVFLSKNIEINEDVFEKSNNHKTLCNISTEVEMVGENKQLSETKKDVQRNSVTYIIKPKENSLMDVDEHIDDHSSNNQISDGSSVLSPTLLSGSNKNKMSNAESNLVANLTSNINSNNFDEKENYNNNSLNDLGNDTSCEKSKEDITFQKGTFSSLVHELKMYMSSDDCIWDLYYEDIDKEMLVISFISTSFLLVIFTQNDINTATCTIKHIDTISRLKNNNNIQLSIAHKLIKEKINVTYVNQLHKYAESVLCLLNCISEDVKLVLDFMFDLKRLDDTNLMKINTERITFIVRSKYMDIVLEVTMDVKLFDKIDSSNINIICILGAVRKEDIKKLIKNIKRDHKFLRRLMSDIKDYIDIIEQADLAHKRSYS